MVSSRSAREHSDGEVDYSNCGHRHSVVGSARDVPDHIWSLEVSDVRCKQKSRWQRMTYAIPLPSWGSFVFVLKMLLVFAAIVVAAGPFLSLGVGFIVLSAETISAAAVGMMFIGLSLMLGGSVCALFGGLSA